MTRDQTSGSGSCGNKSHNGGPDGSIAASAELVEDFVPDLQSVEKLGTPLLLGFIPLRSHFPRWSKLLGQLSKAFVIASPHSAARHARLRRNRL